MTETILRKSIYLKAEPAEVWAYLTDPEKLALWFHKPTATLREGDYEMFGTETGDKLIWGSVLVAEPFSRLEYTFTIKPMGGQISTVKWRLEEVPALSTWVFTSPNILGSWERTLVVHWLAR